jgi:transcriptional regulator with XRE-family HTH domain
MTAADLKKLCLEWNNSDKDFAEIVNSASTVLNIHRRELAEEFQVAESTVSRWANGVARPLPGMQNLIISYINKRIV